jgi:tRNA pseudouridine13 synthase
MFINAYQSNIFNKWLDERIKFNKVFNSLECKLCINQFNMSLEECKELKEQKHFFKLLKGDVMSHYPHGKLFYVEDTIKEAKQFSDFDRVPTGLLVGDKTMVAQDMALKYENVIKNVGIDGGRRFAWVFPKEIQSEYKSMAKTYQLEFFLPKGSYATSLIEQILN